MKSIEVIGIMKTVTSVTPLEDSDKFLVKYGNHKQIVIMFASKDKRTKAALSEACAALYGAREVLGSIGNIQHAIDLIEALIP